MKKELPTLLKIIVSVLKGIWSLPCGVCASPSFTGTGGQLCLGQITPSIRLQPGWWPVQKRLVSLASSSDMTYQMFPVYLQSKPCCCLNPPLSIVSYCRVLLKFPVKHLGLPGVRVTVQHTEMCSRLSALRGGLEVSAVCKALLEKKIPFPLDNCKWLCSASHQMPKHYNSITFNAGKPDAQS